MKLSVIICTFNPRPIFWERTLAALRVQTLPPGEWELVIVDNNSSPPLTEWGDLTDLPNARIVTESTQGFTPALLRGLREVNGDLCVLVHDDNLLAPDYLVEALRLATAWPKLGAWGGQYIPEYEQPPPAHLQPFLLYLAVHSLPGERWSNKLYDYEATPAGAGMCVRTAVLRHWAQRAMHDPRRRELGRREGGLTSCEDFDIAFTAIDLGLGVGVFPSLNTTHLIPAGRVQPDYLVHLVEGHAYSTVLLHSLRGTVTPPARGVIATLRRWRYRRTLDPVRRSIHDAWRRGEIAGHRRLAELGPSTAP